MDEYLGGVGQCEDGFRRLAQVFDLRRDQSGLGRQNESQISTGVLHDVSRFQTELLNEFVLRVDGFVVRHASHNAAAPGEVDIQLLTRGG